HTDFLRGIADEAEDQNRILVGNVYAVLAIGIGCRTVSCALLDNIYTGQRIPVAVDDATTYTDYYRLVPFAAGPRRAGDMKVRLAELNQYNLITRHLVSYFERRQDLIEYFREGCIFFVEGDLLARRNQLRMIKKSGVR